MKMNSWRFRTDKRKHLFTPCIITLWNLLLKDTRIAIILDSFNRRLVKFMKDKAISSYQTLVILFSLYQRVGYSVNRMLG